MSLALIVDRSPFSRELLSGFLRGANYITLAATEMDEAVEMVEGCGVSLVVLDAGVAEPGSAERLTGASPSDALPIVVLTDSGQTTGVPSTNAHVVERGTFVADDFLALCAKLCPPASNKKPTAKKAVRKKAPAENPSAPPAPVVKPAETSEPRRGVPAPTPEIDEVSVLKSLSPAVERSQIDELITRAHQLLVPEAVREALRSVLEDESATREDRAAAIALDVGLTFRVMAAANVNAGKGRDPAESLMSAVDRLGVENLRLIASQPDADKMNGQNLDDTRCVEPLGFWMHSYATGRVAAALTAASGGSPDDVESAMTAGLMHDAGRLVYARHFPDEYADAVETATSLNLPLERVEQQIMLDDHAQLMDKVLRQLNFGPRLIQCAACHHLPVIQARNLSGRCFREVATLMLAERYAAAMLAGDGRFDPVAGCEPLLTVLKIDSAKLERGLCDVADALQEASRRYATVHGLSDMESTLDQVVSRLEHAARPMYVGSDERADPFAVFCRRIWVGPEEAAPNLALVHINNVRERDALTGRLRGQEFERNATKLPVLTVSPKGSIALDPSVLTGRETADLAEPVLADQLLQASDRVLSRCTAQAA